MKPERPTLEIESTHDKTIFYVLKRRRQIQMAGASHDPQVIQWILDTRSLWPEARETRQLETQGGPDLA